MTDISLQASHAELTWLNDKEEKEISRDWADKNLKLQEIEKYYEVRKATFNLIKYWLYMGLQHQ